MPGRVDDVELGLPVPNGRVLGEDRDPLLPLEIRGVHNPLGDVLPGPKRAGLPEHGVDERRLAMVDVSDDGDVAEVRAAGHGGGMLGTSCLQTLLETSVGGSAALPGGPNF